MKQGESRERSPADHDAVTRKDGETHQTTQGSTRLPTFDER
jgi:hypothetical protein